MFIIMNSCWKHNLSLVGPLNVVQLLPTPLFKKTKNKDNNSYNAYSNKIYMYMSMCTQD